MAKKKQQVAKAINVQDRIVELRRVRAGDLLPNPENWRTHGDDQMDALNGVLSEVGIADAVLAFPADGLGPDGDFSNLMLFDGHARTENNPDQVWPVLVTDLTVDEARRMLVSVDPISAMAGTNQQLLTELIDNIAELRDAHQARLQQMTTQYRASVLEHEADQDSMPDKSPQQSESPVPSEIKEQTQQRQMVPLSIVLNRDEFAAWSAYREGMGLNDKQALLKLLGYE
jgi:hypothetical protein